MKRCSARTKGTQGIDATSGGFVTQHYRGRFGPARMKVVQRDVVKRPTPAYADRQQREGIGGRLSGHGAAMFSSLRASA
jgi:hypothetical protein